MSLSFSPHLIVYRRHHGVDESLISGLNLDVELFLSLLSIFFASRGI